MDLYESFIHLPPAGSAVDFKGVRITPRRCDFLAKTPEGSPVFLLHDSSAASYTPSITLKNLSVQFHSTCRVVTDDRTLEEQFAVITCDPSAPELYEIFVRCIASAVERLPISAGTRELEQCVQGLLDLFRSLNRPSQREITGLWGELLIIAGSRNIPGALEAWRADQFEKFDFSWSRGSLEVKATVNETRVHDFALEQLQKPLSGSGFVASLLLQPLSGGAGVMDLARDIEAAVTANPALRQRLWENIASALGSDFSDRLDRRFDVSHAQRSLVMYSTSDIPAPDKPTDPRVTGVRFRSDLTTVQSSLGKDIIEALSGFL